MLAFTAAFHSSSDTPAGDDWTLHQEGPAKREEVKGSGAGLQHVKVEAGEQETSAAVRVVALVHLGDLAHTSASERDVPPNLVGIDRLGRGLARHRLRNWG
eukprot:753012-Hanusia_phi.AAC.6